MQWGVWSARSWISDLMRTHWMDENLQNEGSNVLSRCCWVAICWNLNADLTFSTRDFDLCPFLEAVLYSYSSFGGMRCKRLSISQRLKMYYFYGKINWRHIVCPLYGGSPYLGGRFHCDWQRNILYYLCEPNISETQRFILEVDTPCTIISIVVDTRANKMKSWDLWEAWEVHHQRLSTWQH